MGGVSVFNARLVAVTFALLSLGVIFEFTGKVFDKKTALLAVIFLSTMPGFIWVSRIALVETMLIFFFSATLVAFFFWIRTSKSWILALSGVLLGLGILAKYQTIIAFLIMVSSIFFLNRHQIRIRLSKLLFLILVSTIIILPWVLFAYQTYSSGMLEQWIYAMNVGNPDKLVYSSRFALPLFYLIEMAWPYGAVHPISIFTYCIGLLGLGLLFYRKRTEDKFLLTWFLVVYIFFTLIGNKQWRYVMPLFPVLSISAASLTMTTFSKIKVKSKNTQFPSYKKHLCKIVAACFVGVIGFSIFYSCADAYTWVAKDYEYNLPIEQSAKYVAPRLEPDNSIVVLCSVNVFCPDIINFYVHSDIEYEVNILQYPDYPVDTFVADFNVSELIQLCEQNDVEFLMLFEYGEIYPYYQSALTQKQVHATLIESQRFVNQTCFGNSPCRIFILSFN
ncbi:MAG: phospholipid carrier-dependent glycosyltransferase [Crenarchaeota archaeon]|nr:phospholipid carrier-dependent glycosyltransferase [Thermoproteota archaeon]